jgi:hypothetical protein
MQTTQPTFAYCLVLQLLIISQIHFQEIVFSGALMATSPRQVGALALSNA